MLKKITLLILSAVVVFSCSPQSRSNRLTASKNPTSIMNGRLTEESDSFAKHVVGIYKKGETWCSGVVISEEFALTAAHCIDDVKGAKLAFGTNKNNWEYREIVRFKQHEEYHDEVVGITDVPANDLLLIQFKGGLPFGYKPAPMAAVDLVQDHTVVTLIGFGMDENEAYDVLKTTEVTVVESIPYEFRTTEKQSGSCTGDSGGPVFVRQSDSDYQLVGLVSRGDENCNTYGIYENVFYYVSWIQKTMADLKAVNQ